MIPDRLLTLNELCIRTDTLFALVTNNRDAGRNAAALSWADRLTVIDPSAKPLVDQLRQTAPSR